MPPEVISLLSSSPNVPTPPVPANSKSRTTQAAAAPSRALDYGGPNVTAGPSIKQAAKRAVSGRVRQGDDFMFLSDDSDTIGDLDGNAPKKARTSTSAAGAKKRENNGLKRTTSAVVTSKNRKPSASGSLKRWNSITDQIDHSSPPKAPSPRRTSTQSKGLLPDPLHSPPRKEATTKLPFLDLSSDSFQSSPIQDTNKAQPSVQSKTSRLATDDPIDSSNNKKASRVSIVIDLSDDDLDVLSGKSLPKASKQKAAAWDPISSSMPDARSGRDKHDDSDSDDSDLPDLRDIDFAKLASKRLALSLSPSPPRRKSKTTTAAATAKKRSAPQRPAEPKKTEAEKEQERAEKERARKQKAEAQEAEKERKRIEKEQAKEQRAVDRQKEKALADVNKLKINKKVAAPEMIVDLPTTLAVGIKTQIEKLLGGMDVQFEYHTSAVDNAVTWRRKVSAKYIAEDDRWEPVPLHIQAEEHAMVIVPATEFVKLALAPEGQDLEAHVLRMKTSFPDKTLIYLIEGLTPWMRKNKAVLNRRFAASVRALDPTTNTSSEPPPSSQPRRRNNNAQQQQDYIDEDAVEDALLLLQVAHNTLIHHTTVALETAEWVAAFTAHISTAPYRRARSAAADASFCMDVGQVRTGDGPADTYARALQEIARVTAPVAYGIAARYPTLPALVRGLEANGPLALEDCRKCANRDGAFSDRVVGPAISRRVYKILTGRDPGSMDV
ncbi:ERCC4 domain-containing protein [Hypoxylon fragiforme]|uniref:ERCC4 domain-containing protein n=1 Tax=Hypoxylon fragiforme TaxID=63214 RepID=UPI0020C5FBEF|nr:ERCC4 domain-containing protein [Hypoxylon fragiforme]KAI2611318.1 ERCC4 domain-containing protein [Hypoxylon fragiforme]